MKIILDTNFLMIPYLFKVDIIKEFDRILDETYELCIFDKSVEELMKIISNQSGKDKDAAKFALQFIEKNKFQLIHTDKYVDDAILEETEFTIATQDKDLKEKLKKQGRKIIILRQKKYLESV